MDFDYKQYYELMAKLVKWSSEKNVALDIDSISVSKNNEYHKDYCRYIRVMGLLTNSDDEIERFVSNHPYPKDQAFYRDLMAWFKIGKIYGTNSPAYIYQNFFVGVDSDEALADFMKDLQKNTRDRYPDAAITFDIPKEAKGRLGILDRLLDIMHLPKKNR